MSKNDGGAAFPVASAGGGTLNVGMSLRDYFAGEALKGMLADFNGSKAVIQAHGGGDAPFMQVFPAMAYALADNMLRERSK